MAQRLTELSLPGGGKATFQTELASAANAVISLEATDIHVSGPSSGTPLPKSSNLTPAERISSKFLEVEDTIKQKISYLPLEQKKIPSDFVFYDLSINGRGEIYQLYSKIRNLVLSVSDAKTGDITENDAQKFEVICNSFLERFEKEFDSWMAAFQGSKAPINEKDFPPERQ